MATLTEKLYYGALGGIIALSILAVISLISPPPYQYKKVFKREGKPAIIRTYRIGRDNLGVEDLNRGVFVPYKEYLESIKDPNQRRLEESEIKRIVGW